MTVTIKYPWNDLNYLMKRVEIDFLEQRNYSEEEYMSEFKGVPEFLSLLEQSAEIHLRKGADYASQSNPFSNFERSASLIEWFNQPVDKSFIALIGTKLARIAELSDGRTPNNESLDDSFLDLVTYCALWAAYSKRNRLKQQSSNPTSQS
jgi:hypothetical protein